jgi:DMSO/TMAO reductase YedYZ molybdopterin-dependent catalytic subunit
VDDALPPDSKLTRSKRRWASEGKFITGVPARQGADRLPPGQHLTDGWPVLDLGRQPEVPLADWSLAIGGLVEQPATLDWAAFTALPQSHIRSDIHCVTTWSRYDNDWTGVATSDLLDLVMPRDAARFVLLRSFDGYTTNVPLADFAVADALVAHSWQGDPLTREHGGPARLVVPHLYFWKSAKWLSGIDFVAQDEAGFWEENGYHMRGDPWTEERYS